MTKKARNPLWTKRDIYLMILEAERRGNPCPAWMADLRGMLRKYKTLRQMIRCNLYQCDFMADWWGENILKLSGSDLRYYSRMLRHTIDENS